MSAADAVADEPISVAIGKLADFACRRGDLASTGVAGVTARQGQREHQRIQARETAQDTDLVAEVTVAHACQSGGRQVLLTGRIDLCRRDGSGLVEIKTTRVPAERVPAARQAVHWAQAMLYGFCVSDGRAVQLELLYANVLANSETRLVRTASAVELAAFADQALQTYLGWLDRIAGLRQRTQATAVAVDFPFGRFRPGQRELAVASYRSIRDGEPLLCEAPTGIGKSVSTLYPAIKAIGAGCITQVICLTAKTSGADATVQALRQLEQAGLFITAVTLRARQRSCFCARGLVERDSDGVCPMTLGFHDRLPAARVELIEQGIADAGQLDEVAWQHQLCPFELGLQLLPWVSLAVGDYAYVFDPLARLTHFSDSPPAMALLIDEAHNLPDRARSMLSARLDSRECETALLACKAGDPVLRRAITALQRTLLALVPDPDAPMVAHEQAPVALSRQVSALVDRIGEAAGQGAPLPEALTVLWQAALRYRVIQEQYGDCHRTLVGADGGQALVRLVCLDAAAALERQYRSFRTVILFSGTLRPFDFYQRVLGLPQPVQRLALDSPFASSQALYLTVPWVDTRYRARQRSEAELVRLLAGVMQHRRGNYLAFFPSYQYLGSVLRAFNQCFPAIETWQQPPGIDSETRASLLQRLQTPGHRLGFAIMGGVLGEGVDYAGDALIGVVIVGVGLPAVSVEQGLLVEHYDRAGLDGYDHVYRYPGLVRLLQAAGRLIRCEQDRGVVILIDDRLQHSFYRRLLPGYWGVRQLRSPADLKAALGKFWCTAATEADSRELPVP